MSQLERDLVAIRATLGCQSRVGMWGLVHAIREADPQGNAIPYRKAVTRAATAIKALGNTVEILDANVSARDRRVLFGEFVPAQRRRGYPRKLYRIRPTP